MGTSPTRGYGFLETFLARLRTRKAHAFIAEAHRSGRILDIGCGAHPYFLINTKFAEKHAIDAILHDEAELARRYNIRFYRLDAARDGLPFEDAHFDVVTMLAVFEHIDPDRVIPLLREVYRVLKPGGRFIMTTPARWADLPLRIMAALRLVSGTEIDDHKAMYTGKEIASMLEAAHFEREKIRTGYFELFMNIYGVAMK